MLRSVVHNEDPAMARNTADKVNPQSNDRTYDFYIVLHTDYFRDPHQLLEGSKSRRYQAERYF